MPRDWEDPAGWVTTALHDIAEHEDTVVVLHDLPTGAMDVLPEFLDAVAARGHAFVQEFPAEVIAVDQGVVGRLDGLVSG